MAHTTYVTSVDAWDAWERCCAVREKAGELSGLKRDEWRAARDDNASAEVLDSLWKESRELQRQYDIADARQDVAWARYIVAKYSLAESTVFNIV